MIKKFISALLAVFMILVAIPFSASAEENDLSLVFSPDKSLENTVDVSLCVKGDYTVSSDGIFAYFLYNSEKLQLTDENAKSINSADFKAGITFSQNNIKAVNCAQNWSDESSFLKKTNDGNLVGLELFPSSETKANNGITVGFLRLKIVSGDFSDFDPSWVTPVREKVDNTAFPSAVYTTDGKLEPTLFAYYSAELKQLYCKHSWGEIIRENPVSGKDGKAYYSCSVCGLKTAVSFDENSNVQPHSRMATLLSDLSINNSSVIPSAQANNFDYKSTSGESIYNYTKRGAAIRCTEALEGKSDIRFASSMAVPTLPADATSAQKSSLKITDFGVVYCPSESLLKSGEENADESIDKLDTQKLVKDGVTGNLGENIYGVTCAVSSYKNSSDAGSVFNFSTYDKDGKYTGSSLYSSEKLDNAKYFTFNLVIRVDEYNYKRFYAVRTFITYEYLGEEYTIYDCDDEFNPVCSSRSVYYVAEKAYASLTEPSINKEFIHLTILSLYE